jgi:hypothetical protein
MTNLLEQAIKCDDGDQAAKIIQQALGIESDHVANYCLPKKLAGGSRAARPPHRRVAADGGTVSMFDPFSAAPAGNGAQPPLVRLKRGI